MKKIVLISALIVTVAIAGFVILDKDHNANAQEGENKQPPMAVQTITVKSQPARIWKSFSARLEAVDYAEIRPQVSGTITDIKFEDGATVEKDQVLYVIDPRTYQAAVNQAEADLKIAKNEEALSWKELKRAKELIKSNAISQGIYDERSNKFQITQSQIEAAKAKLETAKINLDYAHVKAPISGITSRAEIKVGNLVQSGPNAPLLTTIVSTDGIYADFEISDQLYLQFMRDAKESEQNKVPVRMTVTGDDHVYEGFIHSFDNQINTASGTIRARAYFENKDHNLLPGMFASVEVGTPETSKHILIPARAIGTDQDRKFVYVVNSENKVEYRKVNVGATINENRVIEDGLKEGEKVITEGIIRIRPGMPVDPNATPESDSQ